LGTTVIARLENRRVIVALALEWGWCGYFELSFNEIWSLLIHWFYMMHIALLCQWFY